MRAPKNLSERGRAVRSALISAALEVFADKGFSNATVGEICDRAGVNRAMIAYHFDNKAGLYAVVLDELVAEVRREIEKTASQTDAPDVDPVEKWVGVLSNLYERRPALARLVVRGMLDGDFSGLQPAAEALKGFFNLSRSMLQRASASYPHLSRFDPHILHLICAGALIHFSLTSNFRTREARQLGVSRPSRAAFAAALADLFKGP